MRPGAVNTSWACDPLEPEFHRQLLCEQKRASCGCDAQDYTKRLNRLPWNRLERFLLYLPNHRISTSALQLSGVQSARFVNCWRLLCSRGAYASLSTVVLGGREESGSFEEMTLAKCCSNNASVLMHLQDSTFVENWDVASDAGDDEVFGFLRALPPTHKLVEKWELARRQLAGLVQVHVCRDIALFIASFVLPSVQKVVL